MNKVIEALSKHAESLLSGSDSREDLLAAQPERRGLLDGLFDLAGRVRNALAPVEPPPDFVADLKRQLLENAERARAVTRRERTARRAMVLAAGAGGTIYLLGLLAIIARSVLSVVALISALTGWGRRQQVKGDV
jgi:hypothetical protein